MIMYKEVVYLYILLFESGIELNCVLSKQLHV